MPPLAFVNIFLLGMSEIVGCCRIMVNKATQPTLKTGVLQLRCKSRMATWTSSRVKQSEIIFFEVFSIPLCASE